MPASAASRSYTRSCAAGAMPPANRFPWKRSRSSGADVVFLSTPHEASLELVPALLAANPALRIVDLSGAFRFRAPETFAHWYKLAAPDAATLGRSRLWFAGTLRRRASRGAPRRESRLLSHVRDPGAAAARRGWLDQHRARNRLRLQIRRQRRGQRTEARNALRRSERKFPRLRLILASPHAGNRRTQRPGCRKISFSPRICFPSSAEFSPRLYVWLNPARTARTKSKRCTGNSSPRGRWSGFCRAGACRNCST